jgi:hypothetical protein
MFILIYIIYKVIMTLIKKYVGGILMVKKEQYEAPILEVTEFELTDSIAVSGLSSQGLFGNEEIWGD